MIFLKLSEDISTSEYYLVVLQNTSHEVCCLTTDKSEAEAAFETAKKRYAYPIGKKPDGPELVLAKLANGSISELEARLLKNAAGKGQIENRMLKTLLNRLFNNSSCQILDTENYETQHDAARAKEKAARVNNLKKIAKDTCFDCGTRNYFSFIKDGRNDIIRMCNRCGTLTFLNELEAAYPGYKIPDDIVFV